MIKDLIHYNLFGTPAYLRRVACLKEKEEKRRIVIEDKKVGATFRRSSINTSGHQGVKQVASIWMQARKSICQESSGIPDGANLSSIKERISIFKETNGFHDDCSKETNGFHVETAAKLSTV
jgi:hypothetical protein